MGPQNSAPILPEISSTLFVLAGDIGLKDLPSPRIGGILIGFQHRIEAVQQLGDGVLVGLIRCDLRCLFESRQLPRTQQIVPLMSGADGVQDQLGVGSLIAFPQSGGN